MSPLEGGDIKIQVKNVILWKSTDFGQKADVFQSMSQNYCFLFFKKNDKQVIPENIKHHFDLLVITTPLYRLINHLNRKVKQKSASETISSHSKSNLSSAKSLRINGTNIFLYM